MRDASAPYVQVSEMRFPSESGWNHRLVGIIANNATVVVVSTSIVDDKVDVAIVTIDVDVYAPSIVVIVAVVAAADVFCC